MATEREEAVLGAARTWWRSKRPVGWRQRQHFENPTINCVTRSEERLARAVMKQFRAPRSSTTPKGPSK